MLARLKVTFFSLTLLAAGLISEGLAYQTNKPSPEAKQHYAQARQYLALNEKEKALEELKAAIRLAPEFVEAHRDFLDNQRDKAESFVEQYEGYVKQNPNSAVYHYLLGKAYSNANKADKSAAEFQKALDLDPEFGWALLAVGTTASRGGDSARAVELWEKARKHAGDSIALRTTLALNMLGKRKYESALEEAEHILKLDPLAFDLYPTRWQAKLNITFGSEEARAEVMRDIKSLEADHAKDVKALVAVQSGYQMLDDEANAARAKKALLAIDPKYYERQPMNFMMSTPSGKIIRFTGTNARRFNESFSLKDEKQKLEIFRQLEKDVEDADAKVYGVYPSMLRSYVALKDYAGGEQVIEAMTKGGMESRTLAGHRVELARAYYESKTKLDAALDHTTRAIEQLRQPPPKREGADPEAAAEFAKSQLAEALHLRGQILLEKGDAEKAAEALSESVKLSEQEASALDLGLAYSKLGRRDEAIEMLAKSYGFEGKKQQEAKAALEKMYGDRAKTRPLAAMLNESVESRRLYVREAAIKKALAEIAKTEAKSAPAFTLATVSGQKVQLADLRGKVLLLNFWATW